MLSSTLFVQVFLFLGGLVAVFIPLLSKKELNDLHSFSICVGVVMLLVSWLIGLEKTLSCGMALTSIPY